MFGLRSKKSGKLKKTGAQGLKIGAPMPIGDIKINGSFIDLALPSSSISPFAAPPLDRRPSLPLLSQIPPERRPSLPQLPVLPSLSNEIPPPLPATSPPKRPRRPDEPKTEEDNHACVAAAAAGLRHPDERRGPAERHLDTPLEFASAPFFTAEPTTSTPHQRTTTSSPPRRNFSRPGANSPAGSEDSRGRQRDRDVRQKRSSSEFTVSRYETPSRDSSVYPHERSRSRSAVPIGIASRSTSRFGRRNSSKPRSEIEEEDWSRTSPSQPPVTRPGPPLKVVTGASPVLRHVTNESPVIRNESPIFRTGSPALVLGSFATVETVESSATIEGGDSPTHSACPVLPPLYTNNEHTDELFFKEPKSPMDLSHLGKLRDIPQPSPTERQQAAQAMKNSLGRKVSQRLKGFVGKEEHRLKGQISAPQQVEPQETRETEAMQKIKAEHEGAWGYQNAAAAESTASLSVSSITGKTRPGYTSGTNTVSDSDTSGNMGLESRRSSMRSFDRSMNPSPASPITPEAEYGFDALKGPALDTMKSDVTVRPQRPKLQQLKSEEELYLDSARSSPIPMMRLEPNTPDASQTSFPADRKNSIQRQEETTARIKSHHSRNRSIDRAHIPPKLTTNLPPAVRASTASSASARSPFTASPGGGRMLRMATMSSRSAGKIQPQARPSDAPDGSDRPVSRATTAMSDRTERTPLSDRMPISERDHLSPNASRSNSPSPLRNGALSPDTFRDRAGSVLSFITDPTEQELERKALNPNPPSPNPFEQDRSLPGARPMWGRSISTRPSTSASNDRPGLMRTNTDYESRPSTSGSGILRLDTDVQSVNYPASATFPSSDSQSLRTPSIHTVKRSKSIGAGLRRALSRRKAPTPPPASARASPDLGHRVSMVQEAEEPREPNDENRSGTPISAVTSANLSQLSKTRWNAALAASRSTSALSVKSAPLMGAPSEVGSEVPGTLEAKTLTPDELASIARLPGTIFLKTEILKKDGERKVTQHRCKPRKGDLSTGACGFCRKGPFPNMWVCEEREEFQGGEAERREREAFGETMGKCRFVMCRMCANEKMQRGAAELF